MGSFYIFLLFCIFEGYQLCASEVMVVSQPRVSTVNPLAFIWNNSGFAPTTDRVPTTSAFSPGFSFSLNESLNEFRESSHIIRGLIADWYSYSYDADADAVPSQIKDGGRDMYDKGNILHISDNHKQNIDVFYNKYYKLEGFEFVSLAGHPFVALLKINNFQAKKHEYTIWVESNAGADGDGGMTSFSGTATEENFTIDYRVFQVSNASDPTICEVYFVFHSVQKWLSVPPVNFTLTSTGRTTNDLNTIVKISGNPSHLIFGYTLLSRYPSSTFTRSEVMGVMIVYMNILGKMQGACQIHNCHKNAVCRNVFIDFTCACAKGFVGDGVHNCTDINECTSTTVSHNCPKHSFCINTVGSYECSCDQGYKKEATSCVDINECSLTGYCDVHAQCTNTDGSHSCACRAGYHGNGTYCRESISFFDVLCYPSSMAIRALSSYYLDRNIHLDELHFSNTSCKGEEDPSDPGFWIFVVPSFSECATLFTSNISHIMYSNNLSNTFPGDQVYTGPGTFTEFSCVYQKYLNGLSLYTTQYSVVRNIANISVPSKSGQFLAELNHYTDRTHASRQTRSEFETTDTLFFMVALHTEDSNVRLVLERCWVTSTPQLSDTNQYVIIEDGCPTGENDDRVKITNSGEGATAAFETQVFGFVDYDTTYIHCGVRLCLSNNASSCIPSCLKSSLIKQRFYDVVKKLSKRRAPVNNQNNDEILSIGPLHVQRDHNEAAEQLISLSFLVSIFLLALLCVFFCAMAYLAVQRHDF